MRSVRLPSAEASTSVVAPAQCHTFQKFPFLGDCLVPVDRSPGDDCLIIVDRSHEGDWLIRGHDLLIPPQVRWPKMVAAGPGSAGGKLTQKS